MSACVLLVHTRADRALADAVARELRARSYAVCAMDDSTPGDVLDDVMRHTDAVVCLLTKDALHSKGFHFEMGAAATVMRSRRNRLIPLKLDAVDWSELKDVLPDAVIFDATEKSIDDIADEVETALGTAIVH